MLNPLLFYHFIFLKQTHVDITCTNKSELSNTIVMSKVMVTSGTASRVIDDNAGTCIGDQSVARAINKDSRVTRTKKDEIAELVIKDEVAAAVTAIRSDADGTTWGVFEYNGAELSTAATGEGTVDADVVPLLRDDAILYVFYRTKEVIDESETIKFAFITWNGPNTPRMIKAKLCGHSSAIDDYFHPYHVVLHCDRPDEVSDAIIKAAISKASGTADYTLSASEAAAKSTKIVPQKSVSEPIKTNTPISKPNVVSNECASVAKPQGERANNTPRREYGKPVATPSNFAKTRVSGAAPAQDDKDGLPFDNRDECEEAIRAVRNDECETQWAVVGIPKGKKSVSLFGTGVEFEEMLALFKDDVVAWALLRRILVVDESETVKFVYISWTGEGINRMLRARLGTWSGQAQQLFSPYHVDIKATDLSEVTLDIITNAIETAAGRKIHVLN